MTKNAKLVRPGDRLLIAITFPEGYEPCTACHPDILFDDFMSGPEWDGWAPEVYGVVRKGEA